jgi:saposin
MSTKLTLLIALCLIGATFAYTKPTSDLECSLCELAISEVERLVATNQSVSYIESELDSFCSHFSFRNTCVSLVSEYTPYVINLLEQKETPQQVCSQIGLCSTTQFEVYPISNNSICVYVVSLAEALLETKMIESAIETELYKACSILPIELLRHECDTIVADYFPELIKLLEEKYPPSVICSYV